MNTRCGALRATRYANSRSGWRRTCWTRCPQGQEKLQAHRVVSSIVAVVRGRISNFLGSAVLLCLLALVLAAAPASADEADWLYDPTKVVEIDFELAPEDEAALELEPDEYVPATFTLAAEGQTFGPIEVGFRLKGGLGSFRPLTEKAAFKVKFDEYVDDQTVLGLERLTLNNMVQDASMVHETLTYDLFRSIGVPASRTGYAFVRINDQPYGVYLNIETLDKISLPTWFESTQHLYEADAPGLDVAPGEQTKFEVDRGDDEDIADLEALIAAANDTEGDWSEGMAAVADLEEMTRMWAVERYAGHWDGYAGREDDFRPNNYYLHSLSSGVFRMMPWGTDQTWVVPLAFDEPAGGLLFNNCIADTSCEALYVDALRDLEEALPGLDLDTRAEAIEELLAPWQALEAEPRREYSTAEFEEGVADARFFISLRPGELAAWLPKLPDPPDTPTQPVPDSDPAQGPAPRREVTIPLPPPPAMTPKAPARLGKGGALRTRLAFDAPGVLTQRGTITTADGPLTVCFRRAEIKRPTVLTVRCRLSAAAREFLTQRRLKVTLVTRFRSVDGQLDEAKQTLTLPRS